MGECRVAPHKAPSPGRTKFGGFRPFQEKRRASSQSKATRWGAVAVNLDLRRLIPALALVAGSLLPMEGKCDGFETYGDVAQIAIPVIAAGVSGAKGDTDGLVQAGASYLTTMGATYGLKYAVDRERPNGGGQSFPSGHTAAAFMGAFHLQHRYGWKWGFPALTAASLVGVSRIEAEEHDEIDVAGAALVAFVSSYIFTDTFDDDVSMVPFFEVKKGNFGIFANIKF